MNRKKEESDVGFWENFQSSHHPRLMLVFKTVSTRFGDLDCSQIKR